MMSHGKLRITADHREAAGGVVDCLRNFPEVHLELAQLTTGDYEVDGTYLFERKSVTDFAQSIIDGRLFTQASRLASNALPAAIILEGGGGSDAELPGLRRQAFQGALISLSLMFQIPVLQASGPAETAQLICYAAGQFWREAHGHLARAGYRPKKRRRRQLFVLQGLPDIGPKRANDLLDRFGTVGAVMAASARDLADVYGIGEKIAGGIRGILD